MIVLATLREPTSEMMQVGGKAVKDAEPGYRFYMSYQAAIDAILGD